MNRNDILSIAKKHAISRDIASPDFFEGALLGNGELGVVACTRPDAIILHLGHNNVWDIRVEEGHKDKLRTFDEIWSRILNERNTFHQSEWYPEYQKSVTDSYLNYVYPRPYPAGSIYLFFDRKQYEVLGHTLDISTGLFTAALEDTDGKQYTVSVTVSMETDALFCRTTDENGNPASVFSRLLVVPQEPDCGLPPYQVRENGFYQLLPYNNFEKTPRDRVDRAFSVLYRINGEAGKPGLDTPIFGVSEVAVQLTQGFCGEVSPVKDVTDAPFAEVCRHTASVWAEYWALSGIQLDDGFLEHLWYTNLYFMRCVLNAKTRCPGLFGNWMCGDIGTAWHGDYHMNYNTQQVFWGLMSANRAELHLPYVRLVEELTPVSEAWAKNFYRLDGACYPHSAYPVPMSVMPYPSPDWGWEIFETPWTVQSLWWHYTYTKDVSLLQNRLYPLMRKAAVFLTEYMTRDGANPLGDEKFHLWPTIVPELYYMTPEIYQLDGTTDLAFTKFLFRAMLSAISDLGIEAEEAELSQKIRAILAAYPDYPTKPSRRGEVLVASAFDDPDTVIYNVPANLIPIFPGEDIDEQTADADTLELARRSWKYHYNEGGNDIVFYYLIAARLGSLNLEQFKRQVRYCLLPNGTVTDRATLTGGRYHETFDMSFMARMGIWIENFSIYSVVSESLLRGHTDLIELFPNWDKNTRAAFTSLRTKGAFLIDSACENGKVTFVTVTAEKGGAFRLKNPWNKAADQNGILHTGEILSALLGNGKSITFKSAE